MATNTSSKKRIRQNKKHNLRNKSQKTKAKTQVKKVLAALQRSDPGKARDELKLAYKGIDKCGKTNVWHPNKCARMKSKLASKAKDTSKT